jgi:hypothetical protein
MVIFFALPCLNRQAQPNIRDKTLPKGVAMGFMCLSVDLLVVAESLDESVGIQFLPLEA